MILVLDNRDSFVHNLARQIRLLGLATEVVRSDRISCEEVVPLNPQAIVMSPGPCTPNESGICLELTRQFSGQVPLLGVCLGHQVICQAFGGSIVRSNKPRHGMDSPIVHDGMSVFSGLPSPINVGRYHSLAVDPKSLPECLAVTATTDDGQIMAVQHREHCTVGVQFHPESILTEHGPTMLACFFEMAGIVVSRTVAQELATSARQGELPQLLELP